VKTLILWKTNDEHTPTDPEERIKLWLKMLNMTKAQIEAEGSQTEMWGIASSGDRGFYITTGSEQEIFLTAATYAPYVTFEAIKVLDVDEAIAGVNELVKQMS
jgi:hypothetical protein